MAIRHPKYAQQFTSYLDESGEEMGYMQSVKNAHGDLVIEDWDVTYEGAVLSTYERNGYDDSDFLAVVWDEASQTVKHVEYATTRFSTYGSSATVDATNDAKAHAAAYLRRTTYDRWLRENDEQARFPFVGREVTVTKGRKYLGQSGVVFWLGKDTFGAAPRGGYNAASRAAVNLADTSPFGKRIGIARPDGTRFYVPADYAAVDDPGQWLAPLAEGEEIAMAAGVTAISRCQWRQAITLPGIGTVAA